MLKKYKIKEDDTEKKFRLNPSDLKKLIPKFEDFIEEHIGVIKLSQVTVFEKLIVKRIID